MRTPQHVLGMAVLDGDIAKVRRCLDQGANPDDLTESGEPVLCLAARLHGEPLVSLLLSRGATAVVHDASGSTPAANSIFGRAAVARGAKAGASEQRLLDGLAVLLDAAPELATATPNLLHYVAETDDEAALEVLLRHVADVDPLAEGNGETPLLRALRRRSINVARRLVIAGADSGLPDKSGGTARALAANLGIDLDDWRQRKPNR